MDAFVALADPDRRRLLHLLVAGERSAGDLVQALDAPQPTVSKHLRALRESGLVRVRKDAQRRLYALEPEGLASVGAWLEPFRVFWEARLDALERHLDTES